ncbi:MAG: hypothetical protein CSA50_06145 [Gammaproteobacteria bacterium]|nr:MAG: hypothetical protein CSA50_06145 [Gammaproteobacteria bacterium]
MKKRNLLILIMALIGATITICYVYQQNNIVKTSDDVIEHYADQLKQDPFTLTETYRWTFFLGPVKQLSIHTFTPTHIDYEMRGKIYATKYQMQMVSYDKTNNKWIGKTPEGIFYVLFFEPINNDQLTLYKHKCKQGLAEAVAFEKPDSKATEDHGWNVYTREGVDEPSDDLPFSGLFANRSNSEQTIELDDKKIQWQGKTYQKITHHSGENRWIGQLNDRYLVVFYEPTDTSDLLLSVQLFDDIDQAYDVKHGQKTLVKFAPNEQ